MLKVYYVYILHSLKDGRTYVGYTQDLDGRLQCHNSGLVIATKHRISLKLVYSEQLQSRQEAKNREKYWKSGAGRRKLKKMFSSVVKIT